MSYQVYGLFPLLNIQSFLQLSTLLIFSPLIGSLTVEPLIIVHSLTFFTLITSIVRIYVRLPNGDMAKVTHIGTMQLSPTLTLENVLCIPTFSFNLISISKLTQHPSCCCIFLSQYCFIQDLQLWKMIGLGRKQGGLYALQSNLPNS